MEEPSSMATFSRVSRLSCRGCGRGACGRGATPRRRPLGSATLGANPSSTFRVAAAIISARCMVERQCLQVQRWCLRSCYVLLRACGRATCSATLSERQHVCSWFLGCAHSQNSPAPLKSRASVCKDTRITQARQLRRNCTPQSGPSVADRVRSGRSHRRGSVTTGAATPLIAPSPHD